MHLGNRSPRPLEFHARLAKTLRPVIVMGAALLAGAYAQVAPQPAAEALVTQLTRSAQVVVENVAVDVQVTWLTPELAATGYLAEAAGWAPGENVLLLVSEAADARLPNVPLGAASVLAVEGLGALPDAIQLLDSPDGRRLSLVRFPVTPYQAGLIALNVPGHGVLVWDVADCITVASR